MYQYRHIEHLAEVLCHRWVNFKVCNVGRDIIYCEKGLYPLLL